MLMPSGQLHFAGHGSIQEIDNLLGMEKLGGTRCECGHILKAWRAVDISKLPEKLAVHRADIKSNILLVRLHRRWYQTQQRAGRIPDKVVPMQDKLAKLKKKEFPEAFLLALGDELIRRGHEIYWARVGDLEPILSSVDNTMVGATCRFQPSHSIAATVSISGYFTMNVIQHKNVDQAIDTLVDQIEMLLLRNQSKREKLEPQQVGYKLSRKVCKEVNSKLAKVGWDSTSDTLFVLFSIGGLNEPAAKLVLKKIKEVEDTLIRVATHSVKRELKKGEPYYSSEIHEVVTRRYSTPPVARDEDDEGDDHGH
jgi:hypothetical protein